jgi:hypothetical protein
MVQEIANTQIRDTEKHMFPITNKNEKNIFQYANNLDVEVDVVVTGTYPADDGFTDGYEIGSHTISSGAVETGLLDEPWERIRVTVQASSTPTSGVFIAKKH